ncbi:hypothetical protein [Flavobacterium sp. MK4S-17]|uniref:hypothetical protein n=1 Tax=Flavobacterium sp. MK4S-17 TaxID=2543737 RepID=UPI001358D9FA|nr:hypothetical protein [Flavobacterium sp. MK4S-17]
MKKIFTICAIMIMSVSFAQLKVSESKASDTELIGSIAPMGQLWAKLEKEQGICILTYSDTKFQHSDVYKFFMFKESDLDALYELITSYEDVEKGDTKSVQLEAGSELYIYYNKMLGKIYPVISHIQSGVTGQLPQLNKKQWAKLFGKNNK